MGINYSAGQTTRNFQKFIADVMDQDISDRADAVVDLAKTPNFGFQDRSGRLRASIKKYKVRNPRVAGYRIVAGEGVYPMKMTPRGLKPRSTKSYALGVERGTPKSRAHPYLRPALWGARR